MQFASTSTCRDVFRLADGTQDLSTLDVYRCAKDHGPCHGFCTADIHRGAQNVESTQAQNIDINKQIHDDHAMTRPHNNTITRRQFRRQREGVSFDDEAIRDAAMEDGALKEDWVGLGGDARPTFQTRSKSSQRRAHSTISQITAMHCWFNKWHSTSTANAQMTTHNSTTRPTLMNISSTSPSWQFQPGEPVATSVVANAFFNEFQCWAAQLAQVHLMMPSSILSFRSSHGYVAPGVVTHRSRHGVELVIFATIPLGILRATPHERHSGLVGVTLQWVGIPTAKGPP